MYILNGREHKIKLHRAITHGDTRDVINFYFLRKRNDARVEIPELQLVTEKIIWLLCLKGLYHSIFHLMIPVSRRNSCSSGTSGHMGSASLLQTPSSVLKVSKINRCVTGVDLCHATNVPDLGYSYSCVNLSITTM